MALWELLLTDGRAVRAYAPDEAHAVKQATHQETTRIVIAAKRGQEIHPPFAAPMPGSIVRLKS